MPCYDPRSDEDDVEMQRRLDLATRVACELGKIVRRYKVAISREAVKWLEEHDRLDQQREARELAEVRRRRERQEALGKLSKKDRRVLGLE